MVPDVGGEEWALELGGGAGGGDGGGCGFNEIAGAVLNGAVGEAVLVGKVLLDKSDGAGDLLDGGGDAGISFAPLPERPLDLIADADRFPEFFALGGEVAGEDEIGSAAVGAVDGGDRQVGQA